MKTAKIFITALAALAFFAGCSETGVISETGSDSANSQATPIGTLLELETSIKDEDIDDYGDCLTSDYEFHFDDDLVGNIINGYEIPEYWTKTEDCDAMDNMFDDEDVVRIYFDIDFLGGSMEYDGDGIHATGEYPVEMIIYEISTPPGDGPGESTIEIFSVECDAIFSLVKIDYGFFWKWKVEKWEDIGSDNKGGTSLGWIKGFFHG